VNTQGGEEDDLCPFYQCKLIFVQLTLPLFLIFRTRRRVSWTEIKVNLYWWKLIHYTWINKAFLFSSIPELFRGRLVIHDSRANKWFFLFELIDVNGPLLSLLWRACMYAACGFTMHKHRRMNRLLWICTIPLIQCIIS